MTGTALALELDEVDFSADRTTKIFTICTLVTDRGDYDRCLESFRRNGFDDSNTDFLWVDNRNGNRFDGYSGTAAFVRAARSVYIVVCHQDIELLTDGFEVLLERLREMDRLDPCWAVAGNSGVRGLTRLAMRITDPIVQNARIGTLPARVDCLDENLLIINAYAQLTPSRELSGFHFYGLDLCLQAHKRGLRAYVIDFHLRHKSAGSRSSAFFACREALERLYRTMEPRRIVRTTCEIVFVGKWPFSNLIRVALQKILRALARLELIDHV